MGITKYIYLPSFNSIVLILSEISGCDIRMDGQADRHDESIRVPFLPFGYETLKSSVECSSYLTLVKCRFKIGEEFDSILLINICMIL